jgi:hypothetical protein
MTMIRPLIAKRDGAPVQPARRPAVLSRCSLFREAPLCRT